MTGRPPARCALVLASVTFALGVARHAGTWDDPWGRDLASGNGAWYSGEPVRNWMRLGFGATRGIALLGALPTDPPIGVPYTHHPPLFNWTILAAVSALGFSEGSFRALPILLSSLSGALVALIALRRSGFWFAASAAILWLALPMSFVYGAMCNPEAATTCFMLLTVALHDRARHRPAGAWAPALAAHVVACQMDWEGHFTVPALLLYELTRPREDRRIGRVAALAVASVVSGAAVFAIQGWFLQTVDATPAAITGAGVLPACSLARLPDDLARGVRAAFETAGVALRGEPPAGAIAWLEQQRGYLGELFTWPALILVAAGIATAFVRLTDGLAMGIALLVPGLLNVLLFRRHAAAHDYWTYYMTAGVALTAAEALRILARPRWIAAVVLAVIVVHSALRVREKIEEGRTNDYVRLASELDGLLLRDDEILVGDVRMIPATFYTRHWLVAEDRAGGSWEHAPAIAALKKAGRLPNPVTFLVVPMGGVPPLGELARQGTLHELDPPEVASRLPTLARFHGGAVWLLRME
jgi:hypothetical protein